MVTLVGIRKKNYETKSNFRLTTLDNSSFNILRFQVFSHFRSHRHVHSLSRYIYIYTYIFFFLILGWELSIGFTYWRICPTYRIHGASVCAAAAYAPLVGAWALWTSCWDVSATGFCMETMFQIFTWQPMVRVLGFSFDFSFGFSFSFGFGLSCDGRQWSNKQVGSPILITRRLAIGKSQLAIKRKKI